MATDTVLRRSLSKDPLAMLLAFRAVREAPDPVRPSVTVKVWPEGMVTVLPEEPSIWSTLIFDAILFPYLLFIINFILLSMSLILLWSKYMYRQP